ncbi:MAG: hypothetical protein IIC81_04700 [Chloroflexi bacterium]|nr:hypothetical protein [Chloroflexota bacterium]
MSLFEESDVKRLLQDQELITEIAKAVVEDPQAMDDLAEDIADKLSDELEDDSELRRRIVEAAVASPDFKAKIVRKLVAEMS